MKFKEYKGLDLVAAGQEILGRWKRNGAFEKSLSIREGAPESSRVPPRPTASREYIM